MKETRIAICGCGNIARAHLKVFKKLPVKIIGCWNREEDFANAQEFAKTANAEYVTKDINRIAEDERVEAVYICTTPNDRLRLLEPVARAGKAVFMEKPLALRESEFIEMEKILNRHPVFFQSGFKTRFHSQSQRLRQICPEPSILFAHLFADRWPDTHTGALPDVGGGNTISQGIYAADSLCFFSGSIPETVTAMRRNVKDDSDSLVACYTFANGSVGSLAISDSGQMPDNVSKFYLELSGNGTSATLSSRFTHLSVRTLGKEQEYTAEEDGFLNQTVSFLQGIEEKHVNSQNDFTAGSLPSQMIFAAIRSAQSGTIENIFCPAMKKEIPACCLK